MPNEDEPAVVMLSRNRAHPTLGVSVEEIFRAEIALPLRFGLHVCTLGGFLAAWHDVDRREAIEQLFDAPAQARHAVSVCRAWLGRRGPSVCSFEFAPGCGWWRDDRRPPDPQAPCATPPDSRRNRRFAAGRIALHDLDDPNDFEDLLPHGDDAAGDDLQD